MFRKIILFFNTVKYLKFSQIFARIKLNIIKVKVDFSGTLELRSFENYMASPVESKIVMIQKNVFNILNVKAEIKNPEDWNSNSLDKLWLYNLHYFDDLNSTKSNQRKDWHTRLIDIWIDENKPGYGIGWEPYPSSIRIVNWIKWSLSGNSLSQTQLDSLMLQTRYLSRNLEKHLLGNHFFANAKALIFSGLFFEGQESEDWYKIGSNIVVNELDEQVLNDGGHFELAPMYHCIFLEDLLDLVNIHNVYSKKIIPKLMSKIPVMFYWLKTMSHPDNNISFFNDSTFGVAPTFNDLLSYANRLKIKISENENNKITFLQDSGYIRFQNSEIVSIIDVASVGPDYLPGHSHADTLSFELSLFGIRFIVNSGVSTYNKSTDRAKQRGTPLHSTLTIDNSNSSQVWSSFRVGNRAKVHDIKIIEDDLVDISASHDGYKGLRGKPTHHRKWLFQEKTIEIHDKVTGSGVHEVMSVFPLHPKIIILEIGENYIEFEVNRNKVVMEFDGIGKLEVLPAKFYPEFGISEDNKRLTYRFNGSFPYKSIIRIKW